MWRACGKPLSQLYSVFSWYTPAEQAGLKRSRWSQERGKGYVEQQSTQPQISGFGRLSCRSFFYLPYPKFGRNSLNTVLTWISIHWFSAAGLTASDRLYYERASSSTIAQFLKFEAVVFI